MIHLRPIPDDIEFVHEESGVFVRGQFYRMSPATVETLRLLHENSPNFVTRKTIVQKVGIRMLSIKPLISRIKEVMNGWGYSIQNSPAYGYKMVKR